MNNQNKTEQQEGANQQFGIQRIYVKDLSFEAPNTPGIFQKEWQPDLNLDIQFDNQMLENDMYEVTLKLTVTVMNKKEIAFVVEVQQAGIFVISGMPKDQLGALLNAYCPNILFPYAREVVSSQVTAASFPQLVLSPINFDALYLQQLEQQKAQDTKQ
jgi:preprotein translocase subunit SecB